jgi:hypothetical protein
MPEPVGDQATMDPPKFERCSILLTFQQLMISDSNRTTELWTKRPGATGDARRGHLGMGRGGGLRRFGCERITPSWDALSSFAHFTSSQGPFAPPHYAATTVIRPRPTPAMAAAFRDVEAATLALDGSPPITRTTFPTCPLPRRIERVRVSIASPLIQPSPNGRRVGGSSL